MFVIVTKLKSELFGQSTIYDGVPGGLDQLHFLFKVNCVKQFSAFWFYFGPGVASCENFFQ